MFSTKMMRSPKNLISSEQNTKVPSTCACDIFINIPGRQSAVKKAVYLPRYFQHQDKGQTTIISEILRRQLISEHCKEGRKV